MNNLALKSIEESCSWASEYIGKNVTKSNISYLIQYGKIKKYYDDDGKKILVSMEELKQYYDEHILPKSEKWKEKLGNDINWHLSFDKLKEAETTKHVHRLHPYKGKFIPQLVEYFLDDHTDEFKNKVFVKSGDIIIDPFMGSGTTLVQCAELGLNCIGIDISQFNCLIAQAKIENYDLEQVENVLRKYLKKISEYIIDNSKLDYLKEIKQKIEYFNRINFTETNFREKVHLNQINEKEYGAQKLQEFMDEQREFLQPLLKLKNTIDEHETFLENWYSPTIKNELKYYINLIIQEENKQIQTLAMVILSRTARSCRSTKHFDLSTLVSPQVEPYYCFKHKKICFPIESTAKFFKKFTLDTIERLKQFANLKKDSLLSIINADSRKVKIYSEIESQNISLFNLLQKHPIDCVFTSPPYLGQIDYHEQHAYAYEFFNIPRRDEEEIGPLSKGQTIKAKEDYVSGIVDVLVNLKKFVKEECDFFIVANDKFNLYPEIAKKSHLKIINLYKRPVLNRTERDRQPYAEFIFHMKNEECSDPEYVLPIQNINQNNENSDIEDIDEEDVETEDSHKSQKKKSNKKKRSKQQPSNVEEPISEEHISETLISEEPISEENIRSNTSFQASQGTVQNDLLPGLKRQKKLTEF
jgi:DNA modification methylase